MSPFSRIIACLPFFNVLPQFHCRPTEPGDPAVNQLGLDPSARAGFRR